MNDTESNLIPEIHSVETTDLTVYAHMSKKARYYAAFNNIKSEDCKYGTVELKLLKYFRRVKWNHRKAKMNVSKLHRNRNGKYYYIGDDSKYLAVKGPNYHDYNINPFLKNVKDRVSLEPTVQTVQFKWDLDKNENKRIYHFKNFKQSGVPKY